MHSFSNPWTASRKSGTAIPESSARQWWLLRTLDSKRATLVLQDNNLVALRGLEQQRKILPMEALDSSVGVQTTSQPFFLAEIPLIANRSFRKREATDMWQHPCSFFISIHENVLEYEGVYICFVRVLDKLE
ncbi:hypothetical protein M5K25_017380 [Dendrobium thyrsiflorum]|uniref:Uncharacterized protein n=1 Tax=Dendrobium thyrsiflorum TaxID=117978 RepID=A0ABD0UUP6_DENTH